jgi:hypothetical protein
VDLVVEEPEFFPTYTRIHMLGGTFQRPLGKLFLKGEAAYVKGKYFGLETVDVDGDGYLDNFGEAQRDHIRWGLGVDFNWKKTEFSPGITQWIIMNYDEAIIMDRVDTSWNLFIRKELLQQGAVFTLLAVGLVNINELYLKPKMTFTITDHFQVAGSLDLMYGQDSQVGVAAKDGRAVDLLEIEQRFQFIGNFHRNNRVVIEFKYSF